MLAILLNTMRVRRRMKLMNEKKKDNMVCCRTCLSTEDLHPIFYGETDEVKRGQELLQVTGLQIKSDDGLPQKICSKCIEAMNEALKFRKTSQKANETLFSMGYRKAYTKMPQKQTLKAKPIAKPTNVIPEDNFDSSTYNNDDFSYDDFHDYSATVTSKAKTKVLTKKKDVAPFKCSMCSKEFRMKSTFKAHMRFHTNYCICELCGKKCRNNNLLLLHKRGRHGMERIHKCSYCEYSAANKEALVIHERRHTGEKPYICDHCGASFHRRSNLVQHIAIHLPDKNFQCDVCSKRLKSRKFLQIHKHNTHGARRYSHVCPVCARRFDKPNKARAHVRTAHGIQHDVEIQRVLVDSGIC